MARERIEMLLKIQTACTEPLYDVFDKITEEQFNWRPAPYSRSINEMMCHLIRVDNSFLKELGIQPKIIAPINGSVQEVLDSLKKVHQQIFELVNNCTDDSMLFQKSPVKEAGEKDTINEHMLHSYQHNLYHLSQIIYLRRALDRTWISPIEKWDKATRIIANYLKP